MAIGGDSAGILFKIKGDSTDAVRAFKDVTGEGSKLEQVFGTIPGPALAVGAAITASAAAATSAAIAIFNLSKNASEFGSMIYDAGQKTGLGAEKLSAFKVAADQSGSSFEQITKGITVFGVEVGKATAGNDEAVKKMKLLGVTSGDLDTALSQAFKTIAAGRSDTEKLSLAAEAFGKKIGPDLIPLIKDSNGNIDEMVKKFKELGLTITDEDAKAADEFGDQLDTLNAQLAASGRAIGFAFLKPFNEMAKDVSGWLAKNKDEVRTWADSFAKSMGTAATALKGINAEIKENQESSLLSWTDWALKLANILTTGPLMLAISQLKGSLDELEKRGGGGFGSTGTTSSGTYVLDPTNNVITTEPGDASQNYTYNKESIPGVGSDEAKKAADAAKKARDEAFKQDLADRKQWNQQILTEERAKYQAIQDALEQSYKDRKSTETQFINSTVDSIAAYKTSMLDALKRVYEINLQTAKSTQQKTNAELEYQNAVKNVTREVAREKTAAQNTVIEQRKKDKTELDKEEKETGERRKAVIEQLRALEQQRFDEEFAHWESAAKQAAETKAQFDATMMKPDGAPNVVKPVGEAFGSFQKAIDKHLDGDKLTAATAGLQVMADAFSQVGQAVGEAVKAFVLFGNAGGGLRKFTALMIANIAQMAAVQAVWELAQGFAMLAQNFFWPDPRLAASAAAHFHSAAIYGGLAAVAAVAGRAVADDSFNNQASSATGRSASGGGSTNGPERLDRNVDGQGKVYSGQKENSLVGALNAPIKLEVKMNTNGMFELMEDNAGNNGRMRDLILKVSGS